MSALLETRRLTKNFGGLAAVHELDISVEEGEILGIIGPNGAGKSTLFNLISGFTRPSGGEIIFGERDITGRLPHHIARAGIARVFQQGLTFRGMSALDNVLVGFQKRHRASLLRSVFRTSGARREEGMLSQEALRILEFVGLEKVARREPGSLPHGQQMALGLAVALASEPKLLLLDEPATGMNPSETDLMMDHIRQVRASGVTVVVVEHDMRLVRSVCDRLVCINFGAKLCEGHPEFVTTHPDVCTAYLGRGDFDAA